MKRFFLVLATMVVSLPLFFFNVNASPPDECLEMIFPNDYHQVWNEEWKKWDWVGSINLDSIKYDTCKDSPTYGKKFAKKYFMIQFIKNYYPFDNILDTNEVKHISDISESKPELKLKFQQLQEIFGEINFKGLDKILPKESVLGNPRCRIYFDEYQDYESIEQYVLHNIDSVKNFLYENRTFIPLNVDDYRIVQNTLIIEPVPATNLIKIKLNNNPLSKEIIEIFNNSGRKIKELPFIEDINISDLPNGIYFVKCGNQTGKFIKE
ncbi:MAG: T9SS type A sorting domain-containing protein [bacterium]